MPFAAADGFTHFVDMKRYILGSPGSHTISGQVCQAVGSGTIYVSSANLNIYVFKSRS